MITGDQVRSITFPAARRAHEGYDEADVDAFLERVAALVDGGGDPVMVLKDSRFQMARAGGYRAQDVDDVIDQLLAQCAPDPTRFADSSTGPLTKASWETKQPSFWRRLFG